MIFALLSLLHLSVQTPHVIVRIDPGKVLNRITPWMYGSCIEDVNHEIYGGLYAQLIFGESFEEPPPSLSPLVGWKSFGGDWSVSSDRLHVGFDAGAKMVHETASLLNGSAEVDVRLEDSSADNAGLILRVGDPHTGADNWIGYEISISALRHGVVVGRHHHDWNLFTIAPAEIAVGRWHRLRVDLDGPRIRVSVDGSQVAEVVDPQNDMTATAVGLRTWNSRASFRNLVVRSSAGADLNDPLNRARPASAMAEVSGMWDRIVTGSGQAEFRWDGERPFNTSHSQKITLSAGSGTAGVCNRGLNRWGIAVRQGKTYSGRLYVRGDRLPVTVSLQSADGSRTYAEARLNPAGLDWSRRDFTLRPSSTDPKARFAVTIDRPGSVWIDQVSLMGGGDLLFRGEPVRADIANKLVEQGITFLRYGGSMVNAPEYRWKKMIGDRDRRPIYRGTWYPQSTNGFGIEAFVRFCRAAKIEPAFAINIEETPEDAADLVEYLNGPADSPWGRRRAENGHPEPYAVRYIEIGNEEAISGSRQEYVHYLERFLALYPAMRTKDPNLQLVIAAWWRPEEGLCRQIMQELDGKAALWDVHVGGDELNEGADVDRTLTQMERLFKDWSPGTSLRACIFEENGGRHDLQRALGHARILNVTQRHGDFVRMDCPANCLQPLGQNDNGWNQGQVYFTPDQVWGMPPYYAQQMAARNHQPLRIAADLSGDTAGLDITATRSEDGKTVVLKIVNVGSDAHTLTIQPAAGSRFEPRANRWELKGELNAVNTPTEPEMVRAVGSEVVGQGGAFEVTVAGHSYLVLRFGVRTHSALPVERTLGRHSREPAPECRYRGS